MIYGGTENEIIQFNEETLGTGQPHDYAYKGVSDVLDELRQLLWDGKQKEAHQLGNKQFMSKPFGQFNYQPFGNIKLHFPGYENVQSFKRNLELDAAISKVQYKIEDVVFNREVFASAADQVVVMSIEASKKEQLSFSIQLNSPHSKYTTSIEGNEIILTGRTNNY
tara:strand:+ start:890 stop:1387 length:498 start_codon:yes stop_codon:yes gene_type:complete